jgi:hypothetical protein
MIVRPLQFYSNTVYNCQSGHVFFYEWLKAAVATYRTIARIKWQYHMSDIVSQFVLLRPANYAVNPVLELRSGGAGSDHPFKVRFEGS